MECQTIETALNNLTLATTNDNTTINVLVESNKQMAALLESLLAKMDNIGSTGVQPIPGIVATPYTALTKAQKLDCYDPTGYCWSHEYMVHRCHTSATCKNKKEGHKDGATRANTKEVNSIKRVGKPNEKLGR